MNHWIKLCVFDAYGTLFNVNAAAETLRHRLDGKADQLSAIWRDKQLQYTWLRSLMDDYKEFWSVTTDALDYALDATGISDTQIRADLLDLYWRLAAYEEVPNMLATLKRAGLQTAILSNGSPEMLNGAVQSANIANVMDKVLSVDEIGVFKPDRRIYKMVTDWSGLENKEVAFMSSNAWDAAGAAHFGFQVIWVNRMNAPWEKLSGTPKTSLPSLHALPDVLGL